MIKPRKTVEALTAYVPPLEGRRGLARLDFNENTSGFPWACPGLPAELVATYPEYGECENTLAKYWGVGTENLLLTDGSDEGLLVTALTFIEPGINTAVISRPTFALIPQYLMLAGAELKEVALTADLQFDLTAIETALPDARLALFASPDNPTGAVLEGNCVEEWCRKFPDTLFVIDEAYTEYTGKTLIPLTTNCENLIILRSFSKAWGMAGLRLGAAIGPPRLIEYMRRVRSPYSVNSVAVATLLNLLKRPEEIKCSAQETMSRKAGLIAEIRERGYSVHTGAANFFMVSIGADVKGWCQWCRGHGVLVRDRSGMPMLWGKARVSIGTDAENRALLGAIESYRESHALIFDLDDTLVDCSRSYIQVVSDLIQEYSGAPLADGELNSLRAEGGYNDEWDATHELLRRRNIKVSREELAHEGVAAYLRIARKAESWNLDDTLLDNLRRRYRVAVLTGRTRAEYRPVWGEYADARFERVRCRDDFNGLRPKPSPDMLKAVISEMNLRGGIYIGNSVDDMSAARDAGLQRIAVLSTNSEPTLRDAGAEYIINSVSELAKVIPV